MQPGHQRWSDERIELFVGRVLQGGVLLSAAIALVGAILYLARYHAVAPAYGAFHSEPSNLRSVAAIARGAADGQPRALIQLGVVVLLATPVARVFLLFGAFVLQRDTLYVGIAALVLLALVASLTGIP